MTLFTLLLALFAVLLAAFGGLLLAGRVIVRGNGANQFVAFALVGLFLLGACVTPAMATGYGQQQQRQFQKQVRVVERIEYVPIQQQNFNDACAAALNGGYSQSFEQRSYSSQNFQGSQRSRSRQQSNGGGNFSSLKIERQRSGGGGFLRNVFPF